MERFEQDRIGQASDSLHTGRWVVAIGVLLLLCGGCSVERYAAKEEFRVPGESAEAHAPLKPESEVVERLFLIGDAGEPMSGGREPIFNALAGQLAVQPEKNFLLFLGDNAYPNGLPAFGDPERGRQEEKLDEQMDILEKSGAQGAFLPGNHDWDKGAADGWDRVRFEAAYVRSRKNPRIAYYPLDGCPGPAVLNIGGHLRLILLDTQWWLQAGTRPEGDSSFCPQKSEREILDAVATAIRTAGGRRVIVAGHHPLASHGPHGGFFAWTDHIFPLRNFASWLWLPLPGVGSLYPLARSLGVSRQDLSSAAYGHFVSSLDSVFALYPPLACAGGHEHALQVLKRKNRPWFDLVSGCGIANHSSPVTSAEDTFFADPHPGFMRIDLYPDRAELHIVEADEEGNAVEMFRMRMDGWMDGLLDGRGAYSGKMIDRNRGILE